MDTFIATIMVFVGIITVCMVSIALDLYAIRRKMEWFSLRGELI